MGTLVTIAQFLLSLSLLIILHECGHFFPAKWFKTRVEKFYLFFDPWFSLFKVKRGDTEYGIGWLPLGGYVKISGMIDESFDKEQMDGPAQPWEFRSKPAWQRLIIMLGGVTVNFILGFFISILILFKWGTTFIPSSEITDGIFPDSIGMEMGLQKGDNVIALGDKPFDKFNSALLRKEIVINGLEKITVERDGQEIDLSIDEKYIDILSRQSNKNINIFDARTPYLVSGLVKDSKAKEIGIEVDDHLVSFNGEQTRFFDEFADLVKGHKGGDVNVGLVRAGDTLNLSGSLAADETFGAYLYPLPKFFKTDTINYTLGEAIPAGINFGWSFLTDQLKAFGQMFAGKIKAKESLGSVISIGKEFGTVWNWKRFWTMTAFLSILLAFLNLLPIPGLDGGYVVFLLFEVITGIKPSDKVIEKATMVGFALLLTLMAVALWLDVSRLF
jgi:regulator of sigma E protease